MKTTPSMTTANCPIVCLLDDDTTERNSLARLVNTRGWRPETFGSAPEFLLWRRPATPCCLVLDMEPSGVRGLELQQQLSDQPDLPVIFLSSGGDVPTAVQAMKAGAVEFLTRPFGDEALLGAVSVALERSRAIQGEQSVRQELQRRYQSLTRREREVMALVVSGLLNKQVGGELGISEITVKAHRGQVMRKMQADSLAHLVTMAARLR